MEIVEEARDLRRCEAASMRDQNEQLHLDERQARKASCSRKKLTKEMFSRSEGCCVFV